jgi:hypothetical protein
MSAIEDPDSNSEPAGPDRKSDDLENWLSDLRTEVSADPSGWINQDSAGHQPPARADERSPLIPEQRGTDATQPPTPLMPGQRGADPAQPRSGGRHRAPD